jgi:CTP:molybdopterin cytidylyltransferase MocA
LGARHPVCLYIYNYFFKTDFSHPQRAEADREIARLQRAAARAENDAATLRRRLEIEGDPVNELRQLRREIAALRGEGEGLRREARERSVAHRSVGNDLSIDL